MSALEYALKAASSGMHCFPLDPDTKTPLTIKGRRMRWSEAATTDARRISNWFEAVPDANYAIAAKPSGLLIIDCDMGDPGHALPPKIQGAGVSSGEDAMVRIAELLGVQPLMYTDTLTVRTPKGGAHYYLRNTSGELMSQASLIRGWIDVRSNGGEHGGYVVGPGSSVGGVEYIPQERAPVMDAPGWLVELCRDRPAPPRRPAPARGAPSPQSFFAGSAPGAPVDKLRPLLESFRTAVGGNQSPTLYWAACAAAQDGVDVHDAVSGFYANTPVPTRAQEWTFADVESQVRSAYRRIGEPC